MNTSLKRTN